MIAATLATTISDTALTGGTPLVNPSTARTGNELLDEMNLSVVFAAMKGAKSAYLYIGKYPQATIDNCVDTLTNLGYTVSRDRERSYREISVVWA